jgi:NHLM bacteriocin system ABC transporter peptidase/ATP-binding protein
MINRVTLKIFKNLPKQKRIKTPTILQMEAVECGAVSLAIIMGYYGVHIPLEKLRVECGISRDGSKASNILKAARKYGFIAKGFKSQLEELKDSPFPMIIHWNFNHFVVLERIRGEVVYINDPAIGPRIITYEELDQSFTGIVLTFEKGPDFQPVGEKKNIIGTLKTRLTGSERALAYIIIAGLFLIIPGVVVPACTRIFVDQILVNKMVSWWPPLCIALIITILIKVILTWLQQNYLLKLKTKMALINSTKFFYHVFRLPMEFFDQRFPGDVTDRVLLNDKIANLLTRELATAFLNFITVSFYIIIMFFYDSTLTFISIIVALLNFLALRYISRKRVDVNILLQQEKGKLVGNAMGGLQTIETLKATGSEADFFAQWSGYQAKVINAEQKLGFWSHILSAIPPFLATVNNIAILGIGGLRVIGGDMTLGTLIAFQYLMSMFLNSINQIINLNSVFQEAVADMNRLDDVMAYPIKNDIINPEKDIEVSNKPEFPAKLTGYLELKNITFGYSRLEPPLISNFDLKIKPGGRVALVGTSGSGKSTIAKLVVGLYEPWEGEITIDGIPIKSIPRDVLVNSLAMVSQDIFLCEGTIWENLSMWDNTIQNNDLVNAAKDAGIHEVIANRPNGYSNKVDEDGRNFSGGQRQRLEIASALVHRPSILVLDEATSALDPHTEKIIDDNLRQRNCTCLIIAHRLSTIRDCDEIIVLHRGEVVQRGTHEELKNLQGIYAELIKLY